jgi:Helix-turn-helix domain
MRPNKAQEQALMATLIASRQMYNACLEELITHYKQSRSRRECRKKHPASRLAGFGSDGAIVE